MVNNAQSLEGLRVPSANHLEKLDGDRVGQHSIRTNDQYRICFKYDGNNFYLCRTYPVRGMSSRLKSLQPDSQANTPCSKSHNPGDYTLP